MMNFTEQMVQFLAMPAAPLTPTNQASNATAYKVGPFTMAEARRVMGITNVGVITGAGVVTSVWQACSASGGTFTNVASGASAALNTSNTVSLIEMRADQLPANTSWLQLAVFVSVNAAFFSAEVLMGDVAYSPANQYDFDVSNTNLVISVMS